MTYGQFFLGFVALAVATVVYRWQKNIDLRNDLRSERRALYRKYVAAVERFKSVAASREAAAADDAATAIRIAEAEILVSMPPGKLPQKLITSDLAVIALLKDLEAKLPGGDEQAARDSKARFLDAYEIVLQAMRLESLTELDLPNSLKEDHDKHAEWLHLYKLEKYVRNEDSHANREGR